MPVPKRKTGSAKQGMRRSHHALKQPNAVSCPECGESVLPHRVCPKCGHYKERLSIKLKED